MADRPLKIHIDAGSGPEVVILPGFGMTPEVYSGTARLLSERCRVVIPTLYGVRGPWRYQEMVERFAATVEDAGLVHPTLIAHSFGGGILLGFAASRPHRVRDAVFVDTLAVAREFVLAREATSHPTHLLRMATPKAAGAFIHNAAWHPRQLAEAAWWGFRSARQHEIERVASAGVRAHVMWASRDSLLDREDGRAFARDLRARFNVAFSPRGPVDHDWMYRHPQLFVSHLEDLGLPALEEKRARPRRSAPAGSEGSPADGATPR